MSALLESPLSDEILNSWDEIATYLHRGLRTVQRWESELGLPVRRRPGKQRAGVIAFRSEIDRWLKTCPTETSELVRHAGTAASSDELLLLATAGLISQCRSSRIELARTCADLARVRKELRLSVRQLVMNLRNRLPEPEPEAAKTAKIA